MICTLSYHVCRKSNRLGWISFTNLPEFYLKIIDLDQNSQYNIYKMEAFYALLEAKMLMDKGIVQDEKFGYYGSYLH